MSLLSKAKPIKPKDIIRNPARVIVSSFAFLIIFGALLLMLPIAAKNGESTPFVTALFTATSATCVTGLIIVDTFTHFSAFGQVVILGLIQLGGLGLVTFATFFNIALRKKMGLKTMHLAQESVSSTSMSEISKLMKVILFLTFSFELAGAVILSTVFIPKYGLQGVFISIFLAVSAYCNAGFDILGFESPFTSLSNYSGDPVVLITIMALIVCGGLGFIVWYDLFKYKENHRLMLHTKIVLIVTVILIIGGALAFALCEWDNVNTIGKMSSQDKILNSFFQSVSARTAGYNSVPIDKTYGVTKMFLIILMFIGAAPGSTGGGIKVTTLSVLIMTVICVMRGKDETIIGGRRVDKSVVYKSLAVTIMGIGAVLMATATIFFTSHSGMNVPEINALFESVSAFATVGLTSGVTSVANTASHYILILTMFIGRVGPVSLALSLAMTTVSKSKIIPEGKIMVG